MKTSNAIKTLFVASGILMLLLTAGFFFQWSWATGLWPWPDGRLSYIFIASITAAIGAPMIWIGLSGEFGAARGGAINLGITAVGTAIVFFVLYGRDGDSHLLIAAIASTLGIMLNVVILAWSLRHGFQDGRAVPRQVRFSYVLFSVVLVIVAIRLVQRAAVVFPWPLKPESSAVFGMIFLGAAFYFAAALRWQGWGGARGQLLGFLAYDLVLIGPFLSHFGEVRPEHRLSLILYVAVLVYSGALATYYLLVNPSTRSWKLEGS